MTSTANRSKTAAPVGRRRYPSKSATKIGELSTDGPVFLQDGQPWTWMGVSCFKACELFRQGDLTTLDSILDAYAGVRVLRVWDYVDWSGTGWDSAPPAVWIAFLAYVRRRGIYVELTLLTSDESRRIASAIRLVDALIAARCDNVLVEVGNEPQTHKSIDTHALIPVLTASGFPWTTGDYEDSSRWRGTYGTYHPQRSPDFARRAHDAYEYYHGGGPNSPSEPACKVPWVNDEPGKWQDIGTNHAAWRAHFAASVLMGAGATFHCETGKFGQVPTAMERELFAVALEAIQAIPAGTARGPYRRIVEGPGAQTQDGRTYVVGNYMVRCQQHGPSAPEHGWTALDADGVLFTR